MNKDYKELSYEAVLNDIKQFRSSGTKNGGDFNLYDTPSHQFFKILFHFHNDDVDNLNYSGGLLAPTWLNTTEKDNNGNETYNYTLDDLYTYNSAWSYLMINGEYERADMLKNFVELLSNINTYSPWYFNTIEGVDTALERKQPMDKNFSIPEERKKITIKCNPDAYDERIGTMLDLYKSAIWSWQMKREVVPANLRKFDMSIYIFSSPIENLIIPAGKTYNDLKNGIESADAIFNSFQSGYRTSYKYIEFHNCEIDYNSLKTGYGTLNNVEGMQPTYSIDIFFDDCYEDRYNEFLCKEIGDIVKIDSAFSLFDKSELSYSQDSAKEYVREQNRKKNNNTDINSRFNKYDNIVESKQSQTIHHYGNMNSNRAKVYDEDKSKAEASVLQTKERAKRGILSNALNEVVGGAKSYVKSEVTKLVLGNLYGFSLTRLGTQLSNLQQGKVGSTIAAVKSYTNGNYSPEKTGKLGNLYEKKSIMNNI